MSHILETRGLVKRFGAGPRVVTAVGGVDLRLERGDFAVLSGPSGSGKSTLLHLLAGLEAPDAGEIAIEDARVDLMSTAALARLRLDRIGLVFQESNLIPVLTARENAEFVLFLRGFDAGERRRRIGSLFERLGLEGLEDRYPAELSGGESQRVAVARAVAGEPAVVLADEPTASLDSHAAETLLDVLAELNSSRGTTFLVASHDSRVAARAGRVLSLFDGRLRGQTP